MDVTVNLIAVLLLLAVNAFFVAAEFALVKARGFRIEGLARGGSAAARLTVKIQHHLEAYLAACQLGITMASLGLGWVGEPAVAALLEPLFHALGVPDAALHTSAFIVGFLIFSSLHIVIGEQVPKTFAIRRPEPVALWVAYPLQFAYLAVWPLNWLLNRASRSVLGLFGVEEASHGEVFSDDELKGLVAASGEQGEMQQDKADMLHNLFEFDQRQVGRVMIPTSQVRCLDLAATADDNLAAIRETGHSRFPVIDSANNDRIVGILLARDIFNALLAGTEQPWRDLQGLCRAPLVVPEAQRVPELFELMRRERAHMALVIDEYGELVGAVTLEDLLEEIVGEIHDETDSGDRGDSVAEVAPGRWEADGLVSLGDVERAIGVDVAPELEANTLSGLFMEQLARLPVIGDTVIIDAFQLRVLSLEEHRVGRVSIERQSDHPAPATAATGDRASANDSDD
jgi:CBS domain containing-hemolysin-like protein